MDTPKYTAKNIERFWKKVNKNRSIPAHVPHLGQCWEWIGAKFQNNYGEIKRNGKLTVSHRVSWEMANGEIPSDLFVLHKCDNRLCVNPDHLFLGTHQDNMDDKRNKGRDTWASYGRTEYFSKRNRNK